MDWLGKKGGVSMPHPLGSPVRDRVSTQLVEADIEIGFNLVDMAETECDAGNSFAARRVLEDADCVLKDIEQRLQRLGLGERGSFEPLVREVRREIDLAKLRSERSIDDYSK